MARRLGIALIALSLTGATALAADFTYRNARFGTALTFPDDIFTDTEPAAENGDGLSWTSTDGAWLGVWGWYSALDLDPRGLLEFSAGNHAEVTYRAAGKDWAVLSGFDDDGRIFYERTEFGADGALHTMLMRYPADLKAKYDPLVARVAGSLEGP